MTPMSVDATAPFQVRDNVWESGPETGIARESVQERHRVAGCIFEVEARAKAELTESRGFP